MIAVPSPRHYRPRGRLPGLALLVDWQDNGMGERLDVKTSDILEPFGELRIGRQLKLADSMRPELINIGNPLYRTRARLPPSPNIRSVQCVAFPCGGPRARSTTFCTVAVGSGDLPNLLFRVLPRVNRRRPGHEARLSLPNYGLRFADRHMISAVPYPSAVVRTLIRET
jgi:hypothetical protein